MTWTNLLILVVVLACPVSMMWMMHRRGHERNNRAGIRDVDRMNARGGRMHQQSRDSATEFAPPAASDSITSPGINAAEADRTGRG